MYAAIDIGSNAVRLAILQSKSVESTVIRFPIRLGEDCFTKGKISDKNIKRLTQALKSFHRILDDNGVQQCRAVATSALREAENADKVISEVKKKSGIEIELINGIAEAQLIQKAAQHELGLDNKPHLIMDIGGGSVEFIAALNGKIKHVQSLKIGTVRLLTYLQKKQNKDPFQAILKFCHKQMDCLVEIKDFCKKHRDDLVFVGTGGNYRRMRKLNKSLLSNDPSSPIERDDLQFISNTLFELSFDERVKHLGLRKDRADVILPATALALWATDTFSIQQVYVPRAGLKDGVILDLMENDKK